LWFGSADTSVVSSDVGSDEDAGRGGTSSSSSSSMSNGSNRCTYVW
jgi:hypothetical protein